MDLRLLTVTTPLKRFYKYILKRILGSFLKQDLDLEQLEVQLYRGIVQLRALELEVAQIDPLLRKRGLAFRCVAGHVACVKIDVPWRRLVSDHCKVYVGGLHLVLTKTSLGSHAPEFPDVAATATGSFFAPDQGVDEVRRLDPNTPESRYSDEGIETLSRLVKRVISRMEVCVQNATATVSLPSQRRAARARLASVLLFSDPAPEIESARSRTLRVGGFSLGILPNVGDCKELASSPSSDHEGEVTVASTSDSQDTGGAGVLTLRRQLTASGHRFHASLRLPTLRLVLTPGSWSLLSEVLMSLSQAFRPATDDSSPSLGTPPDIEDLERRQNELVEETPASAPTTSMVQSLVFESAMPASTSTGHFWHELYGLFEADAQLEDSAATEGGDSADFQAPTDADQEEQQALRDAIDSASAEAGQVPDIVGASVEVWVEHAAAMFLLLEQVEEPSWTDVPRPWDVPTHGVPMAGRSEGQAHFCLGGLRLQADRQLPSKAGADALDWSLSASSVGLHLHRRVPEEQAAAAEQPEQQSLVRVPSASPRLSEMFASARSRAEEEDGCRTPSAPSVHCDTEESLSEGSDAESFGASSVHSFGDPSPLMTPAQSQLQASGNAGADSGYHHHGPGVLVGAPVDEEQLEQRFLDRNSALSDLLQLKVPRRRAPHRRSGGAGGRWRSTAPGFQSKQVLEFVSALETQGGSTSSTSRPGPPPPVPGPGHPIWSTLGHAAGGAEPWHEMKQIWVRTELSEVEAGAGQAKCIRASCLPICANLCAPSVQFFLLAAECLRPGSTTPQEPEGASASGLSPPSTESSKWQRESTPPPAERWRLPSLVAISPAIRLSLRLPDGSFVVGDLVLPRLSTPASRPAEAAEPGQIEGEGDVYEERLRVDVVSAAVSSGRAGEATELVSVLRQKPGATPQGTVHRHGLELMMLVARSDGRPLPKAEEVPAPPPEPRASAGLEEWTRISVLRPSASSAPQGVGGPNARVPAATAGAQEPSRRGRPSEGARSESGWGASVGRYGAVELELSLPGEVQLQATAETLRRLREQASLFLAELPLSGTARRAEEAARTAEPENSVFGFTAAVSRISCKLLDGGVSEDPEVEEDAAEQRSAVISSMQMALKRCRFRLVRSSGQPMETCLLVKDVRIEAVADEICHTLLRPWHRPQLVDTGTRGSLQPGAPASEVTLSAYLWQLRFASLRRREPPTGPWSLSLRSSLQTLSLHLNRLVFAAQRPLLQSNLTWLKRFTASLAPRAEQNQPAEGAADGPRLQLDLRITSSDCLLDVPSESLGSAWPVTSPQGLAVPMPPPKDRGTDSDKWRLVLHVSHAGAVLRGSEGQAPWLQLNLAMLGAYLSDHPANLTQLELLADATDPNEFLPAVGFAPFMEMSSASASFLGLPQEDASAEAQRREFRIRLDRLCFHVKCDTVRALLVAKDELASLLPVAPAVEMPDVVTQKAMPANFDFGADLFQATEREEEDADEHHSLDLCESILNGVAFDAFATPMAPSAPPMGAEDAVSTGLSEALGSELVGGAANPTAGSLAPPPSALELIRSTSAASAASSSCLVDEYIRQQEQQQCPRSPVTAQASPPFSETEGTVEMTLFELPEAEDAQPLSQDDEQEEQEAPPMPHEAEAEAEASTEPPSNSVAVCLFDPEALEAELDELCNQEAVARQEVERSFRIEQMQAPAPAPAEPQVRYQEGSSVVCFQDPSGIQIVEDHFVRGMGARFREFDAPTSAPPPKLSIVVNCEDLSLALYQGFDFDPGLRNRSKEAFFAERQSRSHLMVQLEGFGAKFMVFPPTPVPTGPLVLGRSALPVPANTYRWRLVVCARDFGILDRVHKSVFSHVLSYFEDEAKRPRPSMADMLFFRMDELIHHTVEPSSSITAEVPKDAPPEYRAELRMLPLQLTVDQDSVDFLADFLQLCRLSTYVEEPGDAQDFLAEGGPLVEAATAAEEDPPTSASSQVHTTPETPQVAVFFQKVKVGSLLLSVDYKAKRLDVEALRRGELWELVNLLPLLEGLQVHFRSVSVSNAKGAEQVLSEVVQAWSADLNRTQILRSLTGVTPIRSFANIGGGFAEMVLEPLKQYRQGQNAERVSRTMLRGLISFLRHVTIESIDLTERVFVGAQAALEYANTRLGSDARRPAPRPVDVTGSPPSGGDWLPVERGAASFLQPGGAAEGLQEAGSSLTRGLRNAGPFLVRPLLEIQRGASREQVFRSVVSGIPMCVLRPALGATTAAATAIRGVRNSVDPSHRREMVRKYRGPG